MTDASPDETPELAVTDPEMRQLLGMFDAPAFARRGQDLEFALEGLAGRCLRERSAMLEMVRLRLRQWAALATGFEDHRDVFEAPILDLWKAAGADPPNWAATPGAARRRRSSAT